MGKLVPKNRPSVTTGTLVILCLASACEGVFGANNVCKTLEDYPTIENNSNCWYDPDAGASPEQLANRYGYPLETYEVATADGYVLTLFRIPNNGTKSKNRRPPVLMCHGIVIDATSWMLIGKKSPAFVLSDNGFDVWMPNARGTRFSTKHLKYSIYDKEYWNFSFHEMGLYDLPALIEFVSAKTGQGGNITLMGFSMGTSASFVYASMRPKHAKANLKSIIALAPIAYMDNSRSVGKFISNYRHVLKQALSPLSHLGVGENMALVMTLARQMCGTYPMMVFCGLFVDIITGANPGGVKPENMPVIFSHFASGMAFKTLTHFGQILATNQRFQMYDHGPEGNLEVYNSTTPPQYKVRRIKVPVSMFYGKNDFLSDEKDVVVFYDQLVTEKTMMAVSGSDGSGYTHVDFFVGHDCKRLFDFLSTNIVNRNKSKVT